MEAAQVNANLIKGKPSADESISKVTHEHKPANSFQNPSQPWKKPCYRWGKQGHTPSDCTIRNSQCHQCGKIEHIARLTTTLRLRLKLSSAVTPLWMITFLK